jgi:hypothetical protein
LAASAAGAGAQAVLELTDHAPLPLRTRVRALVWIRGQLQPVEPGEIVDLLDRIAAADLNPALLQVRSPRSLAAAAPGDTRYALLRLAMESVVVADATGAESVAVSDLLAARPDPRVEGADGDHDARLAFGRPVEDLAGLNRAVWMLLGCPFRNGLPARRC